MWRRRGIVWLRKGRLRRNDEIEGCGSFDTTSPGHKKRTIQNPPLHQKKMTKKSKKTNQGTLIVPRTMSAHGGVKSVPKRYLHVDHRFGFGDCMQELKTQEALLAKVNYVFGDFATKKYKESPGLVRKYLKYGIWTAVGSTVQSHAIVGKEEKTQSQDTN